MTLLRSKLESPRRWRKVIFMVLGIILVSGVGLLGLNAFHAHWLRYGPPQDVYTAVLGLPLWDDGVPKAIEKALRSDTYTDASRVLADPKLLMKADTSQKKDCCDSIMVGLLKGLAPEQISALKVRALQFTELDINQQSALLQCQRLCRGTAREFAFDNANETYIWVKEFMPEYFHGKYFILWGFPTRYMEHAYVMSGIRCVFPKDPRSFQ